jgi:hypothetical protein
MEHILSHGSIFFNATTVIVGCTDTVTQRCVNPHDSTMNSTICTTLILGMIEFDLLAWRWWMIFSS